MLYSGLFTNYRKRLTHTNTHTQRRERQRKTYRETKIDTEIQTQELVDSEDNMQAGTDSSYTTDNL